MILEEYISYITNVRRYSSRPRELYSDILKEFIAFTEASSDADILASLNSSILRSYEVHLLDTKQEDPRTVNLHLSVLSGLCRYLMKDGRLKSNPVRLVTRPKVEKRLPVFYRDDSMEEYFSRTQPDASKEKLELITGNDKVSKELYSKRLSRLIVSMLYSTGMRRSELTGLTRKDLDLSRKVLRVKGKGDKTREIPLVPSLCEEISLYLQSVETMEGCERPSSDPLLVTPNGGKLYPVFVDRVVKSELGQVSGITGRKSPHVLRHSLATGLLNDGADLNSIKEMLGHSSLAATQVYTHNSIEKLKKVYVNAHPRAKNVGKNGD